MRKLLSTLALACTLTFAALPASAGWPHDPGAEPTPTPTPCPPEEICDTGGGSTQGASDPSVSVYVVWINGVPFVIAF